MCLFYSVEKKREMSERDERFPSPPSVKFICEIGMQRIRDQMEIFNALDTKAGLILGFIVVSVAEVLGYLILAAAEAEKMRSSPYLSEPVSCLFFLGLGTVGLATICGFMALRTRDFSLGVELSKMILQAKHSNWSDEALWASFLDVVSESISSNNKSIHKKEKYTNLAALFVVIGLICYTLVLGIIFRSFVPKG